MMNISLKMMTFSGLTAPVPWNMQKLTPPPPPPPSRVETSLLDVTAHEGPGL